MSRHYAIAGHHERRSQQRVKVEQLQKLTREVKKLRSKGMAANASRLEIEIRKLERELGIKSSSRNLKQIKVADLKKELRERLRNGSKGKKSN